MLITATAPLPCYFFLLLHCYCRYSQRALVISLVLMFVNPLLLVVLQLYKCVSISLMFVEPLVVVEPPPAKLMSSLFHPPPPSTEFRRTLGTTMLGPPPTGRFEHGERYVQRGGRRVRKVPGAPLSHAESCVPGRGRRARTPSAGLVLRFDARGC